MNALDATLQRACPAVMVPRYEDLTLLSDDSHRFLIAGDGMHIEIRRPWIHAILKIVDSPIPLPYGQPPQLFSIQLHRQAIAGGLRHFISMARETCPLEHAAWLTYDPIEGALGYVEPRIINRSDGHIQYHRPDASSRCLPAIDMHSHGILPAFFSGTDEIDDRTDDVKLAFVVGNLNDVKVSVVMRFVGFGLSLGLSAWADSILDNDFSTNNEIEAEDDH